MEEEADNVQVVGENSQRHLDANTIKAKPRINGLDYRQKVVRDKEKARARTRMDQYKEEHLARRQQEEDRRQPIAQVLRELIVDAQLSDADRDRQSRLLSKQEEQTIRQVLERRRQEEAEHKLLYPEVQLLDFFRHSKLVPIGRAELTNYKPKVEDHEPITELVIDWENPKDVVAGVLLRSEVEHELEHRNRYLKWHRSTTDIADLNLYGQPADAFERMWTPLVSDNPIFAAYREVLLELKMDCVKSTKKLAGCKQCFTIFTPRFPDEFLHKLSKPFRGATDKREVKRRSRNSLNMEEDTLQECFQRDALIQLAKEAGVYKKEDGIDYIRMLRVCKGKRLRDGTVVFENLTVCANADEDNPEDLMRTRFKIKNLAKGLEWLIKDLYYQRKIPHEVLRKVMNPDIHGAGLELIFRQYHRSGIPEFASELVFRAFLIAFAKHIRTSVDQDSRQPRTHWWLGPNQTIRAWNPDKEAYEDVPFAIQYTDSRIGYANRLFNVDGIQQLSECLAAQVFVVLELYYTIDFEKEYLEEHDPFSDEIRLKDDIDDSVLDGASTLGGCESTLGLHATSAIGRGGEAWRKKVSQGVMLAKRKPELLEDKEESILGLAPGGDLAALTPAERKQKQRRELESQLSEKQLADLKKKESADRKLRRENQKKKATEEEKKRQELAKKANH